MQFGSSLIMLDNGNCSNDQSLNIAVYLCTEIIPIPSKFIEKKQKQRFNILRGFKINKQQLLK